MVEDMDKVAQDKCYYCGHKFGLLESFYTVKKEIKPKGHPFRKINIGKACKSCGEVKDCTIPYKPAKE